MQTQNVTQEEAKALKAQRAAEARARRNALRIGGQANTPSKEEVPSEKAGYQSIQVQKADLTEHSVLVKPQVLKNTMGEDVPVEDYFFAPEGKDAVAPTFFNKAIGFPVTREDLNDTFNKVFAVEDGFVFLKNERSEVYHILVPLVYTDIGGQEDSVYGDYQVHSVSFIPDGEVNLDKLTRKLKEVATLVGYSRR